VFLIDHEDRPDEGSQAKQVLLAGLDRCTAQIQGRKMKITFDAEVCAAYIQLVPKITQVDDSWPLDGFVPGLDDVIVDLDPERKVLGIEILGKYGDGPEAILAAIADESVYKALAAEGFNCPELRGNPEITIQRIN
jgi:uncharacterized protein YuzE